MKSYASSQIKVLSLRDSVRKRPGMYFSDLEIGRANSLIHELVANSVDQFLANKATTIQVTVKGNLAIVSDDGSGMPFCKISPIDDSMNLVEHYLTRRHNSPTADDHAPHIHILAGGLGLAVVNAVSASLQIESSDGITKWRQEFAKGEVLNSPEITEDGNNKGTKINFVPDLEIIGNNPFDLLALRKTLFELAHFYPGLAIEFNDERFFTKNGLLDLANLFVKNRSWVQELPKRFSFNGMLNDIQIQVAAIGTTDKKTEYHSWVNGVESVDGGSHVDGLKHCFIEANWLPEIVLVHVIMHEPRYAAPTKDKLVSDKIGSVMHELLTKQIMDFVSLEN